MVKCVLLYLLIVNVIAFIMYGVDKYKAKHDKWRITERTLLLLAAIGGSIGAWIGMKAFHHKTLHPQFKYGVPAIFIVQILIVGFCLYKGWLF